MSKVELDIITSGYNLSKINNNFQKLEDELNDKVLYRQHDIGESNHMSNTLDMNSNDIINVKKLSTDSLEVGGVPVTVEELIFDTTSTTREALRRSYATVGYFLRPAPESFKNGGTLTSTLDVLLDDATGKAYAGAGPFPQTVSANTNPSVGGYIDKSIVLLKDPVGSKLIGHSGVMTVDDRLRMTGVSPSDREWNCTSATVDCSTQIEEAWLKAQELKTNLTLPAKYNVTRKLDMNCPNYFVGSEIVGNGKWATGIEYTGASNIDSILDFRTVPGNTITTMGIRDVGIWGNRKVDSLLSSLNGFAFSDLKIDNNLFNGGRVANVDIAAFVARVNNNYFRDGDGLGFRLRDKPVGWVGGFQNTTLTMFGNYALYLANGYSISNVGYSEIFSNAADGESMQLAYNLDRVSGAFRNNGAERVKRYGAFNSCVLSEFSGYASAAGIGSPGLTIPNLIEFNGGCDVNWTGFSDLDLSTTDATYTEKVTVNIGNANMDVRIRSANVNTTHVVTRGLAAGAAKNPRGVWFERDSRYSSKDCGGNFLGGVVTNEYAAMTNSLATSKNPVSKSSLGFYLGGSGQTVRLSNFPVSAVTKTNAAMFAIRVKGIGKFSAEPWEYVAHCSYVNGGALTVVLTPIKARTGGAPFSISDSTGWISLINTPTGTDTLFMVDVEAVAAGGVTSASMSYGLSNQFF